MKKPAKKVQQLDAALLKEFCGPKEKKFCLVGFYTNFSQKALVRKQLTEVISKYQEDPVLVFMADSSKLKPSCIFKGAVSDQYVMFRTKRRKYVAFGSDLTTVQLG
jgi:hypothetical protein